MALSYVPTSHIVTLPQGDSCDPVTQSKMPDMISSIRLYNMKAFDATCFVVPGT